MVVANQASAKTRGNFLPLFAFKGIERRQMRPGLTSRSAFSRLDYPTTGWNDSRLVRECLAGNEQAWCALIDKYKNLIYSIPIKYHAPPEDAADIFQAVCVELFAELSNLRKIESLRFWLITVTTRKAFHWKRDRIQKTEREVSDWDEEEVKNLRSIPRDFVEELEREQLVRDAISSLSKRCQELIRLLFYHHPAIPYQQIAQRLGLATGSLGFIRGRCLKRLQKILQEMGIHG